MPELNDPNDEVLRSLDARAAALQKTTARPEGGGGEAAAGQAYWLLGVLLGGALVGLGFGWAVDAFARTRPWGTIIGVLVGFGVSIWMALRSARRMSANAVVESQVPVGTIVIEDEDED